MFVTRFCQRMLATKCFCKARMWCWSRRELSRVDASSWSVVFVFMDHPQQRVRFDEHRSAACHVCPLSWAHRMSLENKQFQLSVRITELGNTTLSEIDNENMNEQQWEQKRWSADVNDYTSIMIYVSLARSVIVWASSHAAWTYNRSSVRIDSGISFAHQNPVRGMMSTVSQFWKSGWKVGGDVTSE